jgi:BirA family biotin operon repressor/biotin-[acetyl-CoA-carboxylase] ligase
MIIKWPNDILAGGAKVAGILLERSGQAVVVGFGANLAHYPDNLDRAATSIAALTGSSPVPAEVAQRLARSFASSLTRWREQGLDPVRRAWLRAAHPLGTPLSTPEGDGRYDGLDDSGSLRLRAVDGAIRLVHAGDVFLL